MLEAEVFRVIKSAIGDSVRKHLDDYNSPLKTMTHDAIKVHDAQLRKFIYDAVGQVFLDAQFVKQTKEAIKHKVARELTATFGEGIFKRAIDSMKADPTLKARCILAIENIVNEATAQGTKE